MRGCKKCFILHVTTVFLQIRCHFCRSTNNVKPLNEIIGCTVETHESVKIRAVERLIFLIALIARLIILIAR